MAEQLIVTTSGPALKIQEDAQVARLALSSETRGDPMLHRKSLPCSYLVVAFLSVTVVAGQSYDVPYVPTTEEAVQAMLKLADVKKTDVVYDLGCGDGRIVIAAARIMVRVASRNRYWPHAGLPGILFRLPDAHTRAIRS
jgi:hypothetical protein